MKLCYVDESGTGDEPIAVMVGIIVDSHRMHVTKDEWRTLLVQLSRTVGREVDEIHTRDFYSGSGIWRGMSGAQRAQVITDVFTWLAARKHSVVVTSVDKAAFYTSQKAGQISTDVTSLWRFMGLHLLLSVQKCHQAMEKNKGNTLFIFDNEERDRMRFTDLIANPPAWTDSYYSKGRKQSRLDQIVDVPYFGDSKEVHLIQVADFVAYFLRRHAEMVSGHVAARYPDEEDRVGGWMAQLKSRLVPSRFVYPATGRCECADLFWKHASEDVRKLTKA